MHKPRINPVLLVSPVEDGYVAYDPVLDRLHQLNPVAALIAELSDGSRTIEGIAELACPFVPEQNADEISSWIAEAVDKGLLVWEGTASSQAAELPADQLLMLTKRLRAAGKIQTAYLCGKRVVELAPMNHDAWYDLGEIAQCVGRRQEAKDAYQKYFDANPHDGEIEHLLLALSDSAPPERASDRAIQHIYKNFAPSYEERMLADLKYAGPQRLEKAVNATMETRNGLAVLDLGCGSGLAGMTFRKYAASLTGIDLSPEMIELSRTRQIYDRLELAEITGWLASDTAQYDLIVSCDCLIYFGDLTSIVSAALRKLKPGGVFAFSMERGGRAPFHLTDTGRYSHHPDHVRAAASACGAQVAQLNESFLRFEYGEEVPGLYAVLRHTG
jgi:predicted TPR repeat methyltransferase